MPARVPNPTHAAVTQPIRLEPEIPVSGRTVVISRPIVPPSPRLRPAPVRPTLARSQTSNWWWIAPLTALLVLALSTCAAVTLGFALTYGQGILPRVSAAGVELGGLSQSAAAELLRGHWDTLILRDGDRTWAFHPELLGMTLDADATAQLAYAEGRNAGNVFAALFDAVDVAPVVDLNLSIATVTLDELAPRFEVAPINAGIQLVDGAATTTPASSGRKLNVIDMVKRLESNFEVEIADGVLDLSMVVIEPTITDATPMLSLATELLAKPLQITAFDPIDNQQYNWSLPPAQWSQWLTASPDSTSSIGLSLALEENALRNYLTTQQNSIGGPQYLDIDAAVSAIQAALAQRRLHTNVRLYHHDTLHTVQPGETITGIAWDYGVPYPWIQQANPGVGDSLAVGQQITIPSADNFFDYPVVPDKRIVVSISEQRTRVYENNQLKWDWSASTGINSSPTWPGVYQIISHVPNAYAGNWNLYMPNFMGVYRPVPGADFTNGFHGFPTRGGSQLLWTNNLGTRVTYGCILLSSQNASQLYQWAEAGVVVEILP